MRRQSLRAPAYLSAPLASPAVTSARARWSRQEVWGRCCCNNLNRPAGVVRASEQFGAARKAGRMIWPRVAMGALLVALCVQNAAAQRAFTWQEIRERF